jgi:hypothetical protein
MYSPVKDLNNNVRINPNKNKYVIKGKRRIKTKEEIKNYSKEFSK